VEAIITAADELNLLQTEIEVLLSPQMARRCIAKPQNLTFWMVKEGIHASFDTLINLRELPY